MKQLPPMRDTLAMYAKIEAKIARALYEVIFAPIYEIMRDETGRAFIHNANGVIPKAIVDGRLQWVDGYFYGAYTPSVVREMRSLGATFNGNMKAWHLPDAKLPMDVRLAVGTMDSAYKRLSERIVQSLDVDKAMDAIDSLQLQLPFLETVNKMEGSFKAASRSLAVTPNITDAAKRAIADEYAENMKLYIKDFARDEIIKLREKVQENTYAGNRASSLAKLIEKENGVSNRKAKFLAKQETKLLMGSYRRNRYKAAGVVKYKWSSSHDERVRHQHRENDGKVFFWGEAIIDEKGTRGDPSEAFGCRCVAIPILED